MVANIEEAIKGSHIQFPSNLYTSMDNYCSPGLDGTTYLEANDIHYFKELVGMLLWDTEIVMVNVLLETPLLYYYQ